MNGKAPDFGQELENPKIYLKGYHKQRGKHGKMHLLDHDFSKCMDALPHVVNEIFHNFTSMANVIHRYQVVNGYIDMFRQVKQLVGYVRWALKWCINESGVTNSNIVAILVDIELLFIIRFIIAQDSYTYIRSPNLYGLEFDLGLRIDAELFFWESLEPSISLFSEESVMKRLHQAIKDENMYKKHRTECVFLGKLVPFLKEQADYASWGYIHPGVECALDMMSMYEYALTKRERINKFIHAIVLHVLVNGSGSIPCFTDDILLAYGECLEKSLTSLPNKSDYQVDNVLDVLSLLRTFISDQHKHQIGREVISNTKLKVNTALRKLGCMFLSEYDGNKATFEISEWLSEIFQDFILSLDTSALSDETLLKYTCYLRHYQFQLPKIENIVVKSPLGDQCEFDKELVFVARIVFNNWSEYYIEQEILLDARVEMVGVLIECVSIISSSFSYNIETNLPIMNPGLPKLVFKLEKLATLFSRTIFSTMFKSLSAETPETDLLGFLDFFLENMKELRLSNFDWAMDWNGQLQIIRDDLVVLRSFLQNVKDNSTRDDRSHDLSIRIRNAAYDAEYVINAFAAGAIHISCRLFIISDLIKELNLLKEKSNIKEVLLKKSTDVLPQELVPASSMSSRAPVPSTDIFVGLEAERMRLMNFLASNKKQLDVISIVGMGGIGKTTLAKKVYEEGFMVNHFQRRKWCCVSQEYNIKDLLLSILGTDVALGEKSCQELSVMLHKELKWCKYLIVLDDVWNIDVLDKLKLYFPNDANGSRIVLTSRTISIGLHANHLSETIDLHPLSSDESWNILKQNVFPKEDCPVELLEIGNRIARKCGGLPLAVVVVAGILSESDKKLDAWEEIAKRLNIDTLEDTQGERRMKALDLSYELLPDHLKPLFLYVGAFPEDYMIPTEELKWIWIAEGFIRQETEKNKSLEDQAETYLLNLIDRSLLMVGKRYSGGSGKYCYIHDLLREMSMRKAEDENFMQHHNIGKSERLQEQHLIYPRRVSVIGGKDKITPTSAITYTVPPHPPITYEDLDRLSMSSRLNSLLMFKFENPCHESSFQFHKMLRVFHADIMSYRSGLFIGETLPVHLKYISMYCSGDITLFFSMCNLETLIIKNISLRVVVPKELWKMVKLRHLHILGGVVVSEPDEESFKLENLQTLLRLEFIGEKTKIIERFPNLRRLKCVFKGDCGKIKFHEWPRLESFHQLESFSAIWEVGQPFSSQLIFPSNLKKLSLSKFGLKWKDISTFQELPNLEVLRLKWHAVKDELWDMGDVQFPKLRFLKLARLDIKRWIASNENFPRLQNLVLYSCADLEEIPSELGYIDSLDEIEVYDCSDSASESAKKIEQEQLDNVNGDLMVFVIHPLKEEGDTAGLLTWLSILKVKLLTTVTS